MATATLNEETAKKVLRQVEFYFSDSNLPRDKFLKNSISESEDGLVSLALICSFSRMRSHLNLGDVKAEGIPEETVKAVAEVLRQSSTLKISEDGKKVGRATELPKPEELIEQIDARTIAASPLAFDAKREDLESFFGQYGKVNSMRMPRHVGDKKLFCGTALVEFATEEDAEKVLTQSLLYAGVELELNEKKEFDSKRAKEAVEFEKRRPVVNSNQGKNSNSVADYPKGLIVAFKLKKVAAGGSQEPNNNPDSANNDESGCRENGKSDSTDISAAVEQSVSENDNNNRENNQEDIEGSLDKVDQKTTLDSEGKENDNGDVHKDEQIATVDGKANAVLCKDNKDVVMREDLKEVFKKFGTVKFVDFKIGADSGYIRYEGPEASQKARAAAVLAEEGGLIVKNYIASLEPVTGDAESEYWSFLRGNQEKRRDNKGGRGRGGRSNRGGRQSHGKQPRSRENNFGSDRPNKVQKV